MKNRHILAVEGGGTRSRAALAKCDGTILSQARDLNLVYNPAYFFGLVNAPPQSRFHQTLYNPY